MTFTPARRIGVGTVFQIPAHNSLGMHQGYAIGAATAYPLANLGIFVPFSVSVPCTVLEGWVIAGATAGGNFDIGVYDDAGNRLTSSGATARTVSVPNNTTTMTNLDLLPDRYYYMAFAADTTNNYIATSAIGGLNEANGVLERTSSYVLPSDCSSWVRTTRAYVPTFGLNLTSVNI